MIYVAIYSVIGLVLTALLWKKLDAQLIVEGMDHTRGRVLLVIIATCLWPIVLHNFVRSLAL